MLRKILYIVLFTLVFVRMDTEALSLSDRTEGDILVTLRDGENIVDSGTVELCRAGEITEEGYLLAAEFGGGFIAMEDAPSPDFALWMSQKAGVGQIRSVDGLGTVRFPSMETGLYLIRCREAPEGYFPFRPYLACVSGEMPLVDTYPVLERKDPNPRTAESPDPYLAALGVAFTFTGFIFWDQARKSTGDHMPPTIS